MRVPTREGRRLVIDATYMPGATEPDRAALAKVVDSIAFRAPTTP
jgi:hypothetical protein